MDHQEDKELKKELEKKERAFHALKIRSKRKLKAEKEKIAEDEEEKLDNANEKLTHELEEIEEKHETVLNTLQKRVSKLERRFRKRRKDAHEEKEKSHKRIHKEAARAEKDVVEETEKMIKHSRKELISIKRRVYSRRRKIINALQFAAVIYLFIFSVILMKDVAIELSNGAVSTITEAVDTSASAFGAGWFTSIIAQSASVVAILANTLVGSGIISFDTAFYILIGLTLGNAVTPIFASLIIKTRNHWDLRRGFELGMANIVYSVLLIIIVFAVQFTTKFFTKTGYAVNEWAETIPTFRNIPSLLDVVTDPIKNLLHMGDWPLIVVFIVAIFLLIFSLQRVGRSMFIFLGGKRHTRAIMEKHLSTYWKAFLIGLGLTIIIPSASLLITIMVPLAITRIVTLRQSIPFIIGTNVGTFIDVFLAAFANAQPFAIAGGVVLTLISAFGVLFVFKNFGVMLIYRITRFLSLRVIPMRKRNILKFIGMFILVPALIVAIF